MIILFNFYSRKGQNTSKCCELCGKEFNHNCNLMRHIEHVHEGVKKYTCELCNKAFSILVNLKRHIICVHEGIRNFICEFCDNTFSDPSNLKRHIATVHDPLKKFKCNLCPKQFSRGKELLKHKRRNHGNSDEKKEEKSPKLQKKNKSVEVQLKDFTRGKSLSSNSKIRKLEEKIHKKETSKKTFKATADLKKEDKTVHEVFQKSEICHQKPDVENHVKTSPKGLDKDARIYNCQVCNKIFSNEMNIKRHVKCVHEGFKCEICGQNYSEKRRLRRHKEIHEDPRSLHCKLCKKPFGNESKFKTHFQNVHGGKLEQQISDKNVTPTKDVKTNVNDIQERQFFPCKTCGRVLPTISTLKKHAFNIHNKQIDNVEELKYFKCEISDQKFNEEKKLLEHKEIHEKSGHDDVEEFTEEQKFLQHEEIHEKSKGDNVEKLKIFKCEICPLKFKDEQKFLQHKEIHEKSRIEDNVEEMKIFKCKTCPLKFKDEEKFLQHKKRHEKSADISIVHKGTKKRHNCELCGKNFIDNSQLIRHKETVHEGIKKFSCEFCQKNFGAKSALKRHVNSVHNGFKCEICGQNYSEEHRLIRHKEIHQDPNSWHCELCNKPFDCEAHLKTHISGVHEGIKNFKCEFCGKKFSRNVALIKHINKNHESGKIGARNCFVEIEYLEMKKENISIIHVNIPKTFFPLNLDNYDVLGKFSHKNVICKNFWSQAFFYFKQIQNCSIFVHIGHF